MLFPVLWRPLVYSIRGLSTKFKSLGGCCSLCFDYVCGVIWECKVRLTEDPDENFDDFAAVINYLTARSEEAESAPCENYVDYIKELTYVKKCHYEKSKNFDEERIDNVETDVCPICLTDFEDNVPITQLQCSHFYHSKCADGWFQRSWFCPMCRADVRNKGDLPRFLERFIGFAPDTRV